MARAVELSEFDIVFESRKAIKSQALANFVRELTSIQKESSTNPDTWKIYVDGSSNSKGSGTGVIIENPEGVSVEYSMQMKFETSNNQAEYEAFIAGPQQAKELRARRLQIYSDSQVVTSQIAGSYQAKGPLLAKYLNSARQLIAEFEKVEVSHIPRNENSRADILSKLASTKGWGNHRTVVEQNIPEPTCVMQITEGKDWCSTIIDYIENGTLPPQKEEARKLVKDAALYTMVEGKLYKKGAYSPLLKCLSSDKAKYVLSKIHEGINGQHVGGRALARKALRAGYFWLSMSQDAKEHVQRCDQFQKHGVEPVETITTTRVQRFFERNLICKFGIPAEVVTDNRTQFTSKTLQELMANLHIRHRFASVEHPQSNGQAEAANQVIIAGLRKRLEQCAKGKWVEEL
ncbi:uncharacterized protein LOC133298653, partial [Gastrolobium bilobum]|uniref:uncharacterized protein LOC133298653 n=1 Tax=Gastrolobium bilobum TaxID=150636 RepID=UPI002AB251F7